VRALGIFARAPIPGQVKRRLAADVGPSTAADVYWRLGRQVVESVAGPGYRATVWFTPSNQGRFVREWLEGVGRIEFRPQAPGGLGARMHHAFSRHFTEGAALALLIGTDCPGVDRRLIVEAFAALGSHDVVLGPAVDGGYYLVGLRRPRSELFRGITWSTPAVLAQTKARARSLGLTVRLLRPLRDVDTARDARALGLLKP
jgi:hypothetical protein